MLSKSRFSRLYCNLCPVVKLKLHEGWGRLRLGCFHLSVYHCDEPQDQDLYMTIERDPNIVNSSMSRKIVEDGITFDVQIYKIEGTDEWSLDVVTPDGTSVVWDDLFSDDEVAFEEAINTIRSEGALAFQNGGDNVIPFRSSD